MKEANFPRIGDEVISPGSIWNVDQEAVTVIVITGTNSVVVENAGGQHRSVKPAQLQPIQPARSGDTSLRVRATDDVDRAQWDHALAIEADLSNLAKDSELASGTIDTLAAKWGVSKATVWRRIVRYREQGDLTAFINRRRGLKTGAVLVDREAESVIGEVARRWWRETENATIAEIAPTVQVECEARGLTTPSRATIARRLRVLRAEPQKFSGEVRTSLRESRRLMRGHYEVAQALDVVQIDHTVADVFVVDAQSRHCIGRPTFTVAIDVATRCVLGFCLSLEAPSALLVALCLGHAVFPKEGRPGGPGSTVEWPMYGRMKALHSDNGKEFHSRAFNRGCDLNRIEVIYRPPGTPRFGGHVERLIGTMMRRVRLLPGNSYSDLLRRRPRRAEQRASLTLNDLEWYITEEIARYHHSVHRALGITPRTAWERAWTRKVGVELPPVPRDRTQFILDFLPVKSRVIGREGIELFGLKYADAVLRDEVNLGQPRTVRFDPRDMSRIYLEGTEGRYLTIPLRDARMPAMSLWEWRAVRRLHRTVAARIDSERIVSVLESLEKTHQTDTTSLRRQRRATRRAQWRELQMLQALPAPNVALAPVISTDAAIDQLAWEILE